MGENVTLEARLVHRQLWNCGTIAKQAPDQIKYVLYFWGEVPQYNDFC